MAPKTQNNGCDGKSAPGTETSLLILFSAFICTIPFGTVRPFPAFGWLSLTKIGFFLLLFGLGAAGGRGWRPPSAPRVLIALPVFLGGALLSVLAGGAGDGGWFSLLRLAGLGLLCLITSWMIRIEREGGKISATLLMISAPISALAIYQTRTGRTIGGLGIYEPFGRLIDISPAGGAPAVMRASATFDHPNLFGSFLLAALAFGFLLFFRKRSARAGQALIGGGLVLSLIALWYTFSRSAGLGLAVILGVLAATRAGFRRAGLLTLTALVLAVALLSPAGRAVLWGRGSGRQPYDSGRLLSYRVAGRMIRDHPLTGVGLGGFDHAFDAYRRAGETISQDPAHTMDAHNTFLALGSEGGLLTLIPFFYLAFSALIRAAKRAGGVRAGSWFTAVAVLGGLAALFLQSLFNSLQYQEVLWILLGAGAGLEPERAS